MPTGGSSSSGGSPNQELPGMPGNDSTSSSGNNGDASANSNPDGWLEGQPRGNGDGEWQTSNQSVPQGRPAEQPGASGSGDKSDESGSEEDAELAEALGNLDGNILAEREALRTNAKPGGDTEEAEDSLSKTQGSPQGAAAARARIGDTPAPPKRGEDAVATNLPDAKDDDIIARQLREAAMQETDPELKEKLWAEYRRYKRG